MNIINQREKDVEKALIVNLSKQTRNNPNIAGGEYGLYYRFTNEFLNDFISKAKINSTTEVLSVLASGDQAFNFILAGANHIDAFDINRLTEYFALGFKKTAIQVLSYEQFIKLFNYNSLNMDNKPNLELEKSIIESCPEEYKKFWQELTYALKEHNLNQSVFEASDGFHSNIVKKYDYNNYMLNEEQYKILQKRLDEATITFNCVEIQNVSKTFKKKYDYVFISNILDSYDSHLSTIPDSLNVALKIYLDIYHKNVKKQRELIFSTYDYGGFGDEFVDMYNSIKPNVGEKILYSGKLPLIHGLRKQRVVNKR